MSQTQVKFKLKTNKKNQVRIELFNKLQATVKERIKQTKVEP